MTENTKVTGSAVLLHAIETQGNGDEAVESGRGEMAYGVSLVVAEAIAANAFEKSWTPQVIANWYVKPPAGQKSPNEGNTNKVKERVFEAAGLTLNTKDMSNADRDDLKIKKNMVTNGIRLWAAIERINMRGHNTGKAITWDSAAGKWNVPLELILDAITPRDGAGKVLLKAPVDQAHMGKLYEDGLHMQRKGHFVHFNKQDDAKRITITYDKILKASGETGTTQEKTKTTGAQGTDTAGVAAAVKTLVGLPKPADLGDVTKPDTEAHKLCEYVVNNYYDTVYQMVQERAKAKDAAAAAKAPAKNETAPAPKTAAKSK